MFRKRVKILLWPGLGLKRWVALFLIGFAMFGLGMSFSLGVGVSPKLMPVLRILTLSGYPPQLRGIVFVALGTGMVGFAAIQAYKLLISGAIIGRGRVDVLTALDQRRRLKQGLRVVAIGGGTGLSTVLRGLKRETSNLTAIVNISDDGGSSGRLRSDFNIPPPGDARSCLLALSEDESLLESLFNYRFEGNSSLDGHSLGNLLLAALYDMHGGFSESLEAAAQLLALSGRVVPVATDSDIVLMGKTTSGQILRGESAVGHAPDQLMRVWIEPEEAAANVVALEAIQDASLIVIGPGSLYTSVIPNFLLRGISEAVERSSAPKVFICNVATQPHETDGYGVREHVEAFQAHSGVTVTHVVVNSDVAPLPKEWGQTPVAPESQLDGVNYKVIQADVIDENLRTRHDPNKLASVLTAVLRLR